MSKGDQIVNRLKQKYMQEVAPKLQEEFGIKNIMAVPKLKKIVVSISLGEAKDNSGILDKVKVYLSALSGQTPVVTKAKKSIAAFKVVMGQPIGMVVTIRGEKMFSFFDKLVNVVLPKVRDFKGISDKAFDMAGNLNLGMKEQVIFPEVDYKSVDKTRGLCVTVVTSAGDYKIGKRFLELMGMPFVGGNYGQDK